MKKVLSVLLTGAMAVSMLAGCGGGSSAPAQSEAPAEQGKEEAPAEQGGAEAPAEGEAQAEGTGKVAIVTNTVSQNEEEYRSAETMSQKYGDRIVHVTWPDNFMTEQEQMITTVSKLAADPEIKAVIINQAVPGTNAAIDKLLETRDDMLIIYGTPQENPEDVAARADIILKPNELVI